MKLQLIQLVWALQEFCARNCELVSSEFDSGLRNLLCLRQKARCARLLPLADSRTFSALSYLGQFPRIESLTKTNLTPKSSGEMVIFEEKNSTTRET